MTALISHAYERITKEPTCTEQGYTTSTCTMCGSSYVSDYTEPTGHSWDEGTEDARQYTYEESTGTKVTPESLYEAQLRNRLGYVPGWLNALK